MYLILLRHNLFKSLYFSFFFGFPSIINIVSFFLYGSSLICISITTGPRHTIQSHSLSLNSISRLLKHLSDTDGSAQLLLRYLTQGQIRRLLQLVLDVPQKYPCYHTNKAGIVMDMHALASGIYGRIVQKLQSEMSVVIIIAILFRHPHLVV